MQEVLMSPTQIVPKQSGGKYWPGFVLHGMATLFLDDDQVNAIKVALAMILPVVIVHARVRISEISSISSMVVKAVNSSLWCSQTCGS